MAYKYDRGNGSLFKNGYKEKENQPDYKGGGCCSQCGEQIDFSAWIRTTRNGDKYFSMAIQKPYKPREDAPKQDIELEDDIPF